VNGLHVIDEESLYITLVHGCEYMRAYIVIKCLEVSHNTLNNRVKII